MTEEVGTGSPLALVGEARYILRAEQSMHRAAKFIVFGLSHAAVFALTFATFTGHLIQVDFANAAKSSLHRVGRILLSHNADARAPSSLETDLASLPTEPATDVIRLVAFLKQGRFQEARSVCVRLEWHKCDASDLADMKKMLIQ